MAINNLNANLNAKRLLFIGAHPDDIELGCGATIAKYAATCDIYCIILSKSNEYLKRGSELQGQAIASLTSLGVQENRIILCDFLTRHFESDRQAIADKMAQLQKEISPDIVFCHSQHDLHQDHQTVYNEARRIFQHNILAFEIIRSSTSFEPMLFIPVSEQEATKKINSLLPYYQLLNKTYLG